MKMKLFSCCLCGLKCNSDKNENKKPTKKIQDNIVEKIKTPAAQIFVFFFVVVNC